MQRIGGCVPGANLAPTASERRNGAPAMLDGRVIGTVALGYEEVVDTLPSNADQAEQVKTGTIQ